MRVVIGEDTVLLRAGVARLLEDAGMEVVGQAADAEDLMRKVRAHKPDVAIVDIRMPPGNADDGLRAAQEMRAELPGIGVLVLSQYAEEHYVTQLLPAAPRASATCSRSGSPTSTGSSTASAGSPRAARRWIPRSSR